MHSVFWLQRIGILSLCILDLQLIPDQLLKVRKIIITVYRCATSPRRAFCVTPL